MQGKWGGEKREYARRIQGNTGEIYVGNRGNSRWGE